MHFQSRPARRKRPAWIGLLALAIALLSVVVGTRQRHDMTFDLYDEQAHYDYALDLRHGTVPAWGDRYSQSTLRVLSCLSVSGGASHGCGVATRVATDYAPDGYSYEAQQPPLAYVPYALTAEPSAAPATALAAARRGGIIWTAITAALLVALGLVTELTLLELAALLCICLLSPVAVHAWATVTNDSAGVAAGAIAVLLVARATRTKRPMIWTGLIGGLIIGLLKPTFLTAPAALLLGGLLAEVASSRRAGRRNLAELWRRHGCALMIVIGVGVSGAAWAKFQAWRAVVPSSVVLRALLGGQISATFPWHTVYRGIKKQFSLWLPYRVALLYAVCNFVLYLAVAGTVISWSRRRLTAPVRWTALSVLIGLITLPFVSKLTLYSEGHYNFVTPARYALPMLPVMAMVLVRSLPRQILAVVGVGLPLVAVAGQLFIWRF